MDKTKLIALGAAVAIVGAWYYDNQLEQEVARERAIDILPAGVEEAVRKAVDAELILMMRRDGKNLIVTDTILHNQTTIRAVTSYAVDCLAGYVTIDFHLGDNSPYARINIDDLGVPLGVRSDSVAAERLCVRTADHVRDVVAALTEDLALAPPVVTQQSAADLYEPEETTSTRSRFEE